MIVKAPAEKLPASRRASALRSNRMGHKFEIASRKGRGLVPPLAGACHVPHRFATNPGTPHGSMAPTSPGKTQPRNFGTPGERGRQRPDYRSRVCGTCGDSWSRPSTSQPPLALAAAGPSTFQQFESNEVKDQPRFRPEGPSVPASLRIQPPALR